MSEDMALIVQFADKDDVIWEADDGTFNVTRIMSIAKLNADRCGPYLLDLDPAFAAYIQKSCGVDLERALAMPLGVATREALLAIEEEDDATVRMIDGHHRLVRMAAAGLRQFECWIVPPDLLPPKVRYLTVPVAELPPGLAAKGIRSEDLR